MVGPLLNNNLSNNTFTMFAVCTVTLTGIQLQVSSLQMTTCWVLLLKLSGPT